MNIYLILFPHQKAQIEAWCWGPGCGKGIVSAVDIGPSATVVCREESCPYLDRQMDEPLGDLDGEPCYLRKLKEVP